MKRLRRVPSWVWIACLTLCVSALVAGYYFGDRTWLRMALEAPYQGRCNKELTRPQLVRSLALGTEFMLAHQKAAGNFDYEYDWKSKRQSTEDNEVRQAGAVWGLALLYQDRPTPRLAEAVERGLAFFSQRARYGAHGARCVAYPGSRNGTTGTIAVLALALTEYLRGAGPELPEARRAAHMAVLDQYLHQLVAALNPDGLFYADFSLADCTPSAEHSPYSDGEALLALIKAARYLGHRELEPAIRRAADAGHRLNIERALKQDRDSDLTKGYYQWSSMAFFELATSGWPDTERYGTYVLELADWMIDVHHTLVRTRNTGYAYEGLIHAYEIARLRKDGPRQAKIGCIVDLGLSRLMGWQVGSPLANRWTRDAQPDDRLALGGIQNSADEPALRIDVTQHQMHATTLALQYVYKE